MRTHEISRVQTDWLTLSQTDITKIGGHDSLSQQHKTSGSNDKKDVARHTPSTSRKHHGKVHFALRPPASLVDTLQRGANLHSSAAMCLQLFGVTQILNSKASCCASGASLVSS